jgi:hypothetical protein
MVGSHQVAVKRGKGSEFVERSFIVVMSRYLVIGVFLVDGLRVTGVCCQGCPLGSLQGLRQYSPD